jgi:hypothetical protein
VVKVNIQEVEFIMSLRRALSVGVFACLTVLAAPAAHATGIPGCTSIISLPKNMIWKGCSGSGHLAKDPRGKGAALIARPGATLNAPACVRIRDFQGNIISGLRAYSRNLITAYKFRNYTNYVRGCGGGDTHRVLQQKSQNKEVYLQMNGGLCIKINRTFQNINSSQKTCAR